MHAKALLKLRMKKNAVVLASQHLNTINAKTTHGLLRHSEKFNIIAIIDEEYSGQNTRQVLGQDFIAVPIFSSISDFLKHSQQKAQYCITGIAVHGGLISEALRVELLSALRNGISVINSLHQFLTDDIEAVRLAEESGLELIDVRKAKPKSELHFWSGEISEVACPIIAVFGTDCALGKRTTAQWIVRQARQEGLNAHMIYTGQTGYLQGSPYGFIFDCTPNDFVSGEMEAAILKCWRAEKPQLIVLEGQSSLRNPSGPCGAEFILSGRAKSIILQHAPHRQFFEGYEELGYQLPSAREEIDLIKMYGAEVLAIAMNTEGLPPEKIDEEKKKLQLETGLPVIATREEGCAKIVEILKEKVQ